MRTPEDHLDALIARLERAAEQLRSGEISPDAAATLVEECASLATEASAELERRARAGSAEETPSTQGTLLDMPEPATVYPDHLRERVDAYLIDVRFADGEDLAGLVEAMRYSLLAPGKRIRPVLALATAIAIGREPAEVMPLAAGIELIHTYSLIHDDLPAMDDDDLRRGRPTCHVAYGENVAILAGDALYAEAFRHIVTHQAGDPAALLRAMGRLAGATGVDGMVGGQYLDVTEKAPEGLDGLRRLHALKTGRLIASCVECVLELSHAGETETMLLGQFAAELGVLFQIVDDILDVTGTDAALGKPSGSDERHGKRTYVSEHGLERARSLASASYDAARDALDGAVPAGAAELKQITEFIYTRTS